MKLVHIKQIRGSRSLYGTFLYMTLLPLFIFGIVLMIYSSYTQSVNIKSEVSDNLRNVGIAVLSAYDAGYEAAQVISGMVDKGAKTVILDVPAELKLACTMGQGFEDYAKETGAFEILEDYAQTITSIEVGYQAASEVLTKYQDIDVLYCVNDNTAIGAAQAIEAAGRQNDGIIIWGYCGMPAALDAIAQGKMTGTSYSDPFYEGYAAMVSAMNYVQLGVNATKLGNEFYADVMLPTKNVTEENVIETIRGTHWDMSAYNY